MKLLCIDPGTTSSGVVALSVSEPGRPPKVVSAASDIPNGELVATLHWHSQNAPQHMRVLIEEVECYGMAVGRDVFETVFWSGRFYQAAQPISVHRMGRGLVKDELCGSRKAKDGNVRQALIDLYGGDALAKGKKAAPGPLYGVSRHAWSALALGVAWLRIHGNSEPSPASV